MKSLLRVTVVCSFLVLLFSCVWFTQKQAKRTMMPSSKSIDQLLNPGPNKPDPQTVMPGSKSGTLIMPGSKSWTGGTSVSAGALQSQPPQPQTPPAKP